MNTTNIFRTIDTNLLKIKGWVEKIIISLQIRLIMKHQSKNGTTKSRFR